MPLLLPLQFRVSPAKSEEKESEKTEIITIYGRIAHRSYSCKGPSIYDVFIINPLSAKSIWVKVES